MNYITNMPPEFSYMLTVVLCVLLISAVSTDLSSHRISNSLVIMVLFTGLLAQLTGDLTMGIAYWLGGLGVGLAMFLPFYIGGGMGAGDVKLMAAVAGFFGPQEAVVVCGAALAAGLPLAIVYIIARWVRQQLHASEVATVATATGVHHKHDSTSTFDVREGKAQRIPFASAIAAGTVFGLWWFGYAEQLAGVLIP